MYWLERRKPSWWLPGRAADGSRLRGKELPVGSRWYCRHQHALSRYFQLPTRLRFCCVVTAAATTAKGRGLSSPASVHHPCRRGCKYCLLDFDGRACGLEVL